jgi:hypothetical protein
VRVSGGALFSLALAAIAGYALYAASTWPLKAALFPRVTAAPLLVLALLQLFLQLRAPELLLTQERRRTLTAFAWMAGFVLLVVLGGFPTAIPVFVFSYLMVHASAGWVRSTLLSAAAWGFFHLLFERMLRLPFDSGLLGSWLAL